MFEETHRHRKGRYRKAIEEFVLEAGGYPSDWLLKSS
jgi:hypothetical protein